MEIEFGKENLRDLPAAFVERMQKQIRDVETYLTKENLQEESRAELAARKERLKEAIKNDRLGNL